MRTKGKTKKAVRRSVTLSRDIDNQVQKLARKQNWSANRVLEDLIQVGIEAKEAEKQRFFSLAERLHTTKDIAEIQQIKAELARMTFGV